ncbi:thermonuclease family protein [Candidatus Acetothermia bacterium]|nr:thermonuclease family protein [Candidatus Acetothermia bacterium]MBI3644210.1 thermonuclease family protein [Candidatus Acetothermia bacterium]
MAKVLYHRLLPLLFVFMGVVLLLPSAEALPPAPAPTITAEVSRVLDGQSMRVLLHSGAVENVRYIGIDSPGPTPSECFGPEATLYNRDLTIDRTVWLEMDEQQRDSQGNLLAYVYLDSQGLTMINAILVAQGFARIQDVSKASPNLRYSSTLSQLQDEAKANNRGLWEACPATPLPSNNPPQATFTFSPSNPEPGQAVTFDGTSSVDLDGSISSYAWNFGDGGTATSVTVTHVFSAAGLFTVTLTVTDNRGSVGVANRNVAVGSGGTSSGGQTPPITNPPVVTGSKPVIIESIHYDAAGDDNSSENGEWIVLLASTQDVDMSDWTVADELGDRGVTSHVYRIPSGFVIKASSRATVFTGCGTNTATELHWCANTQIWDNGEDTAVLRNNKSEEIDRCHYGDPDGDERGVSEFNCVTFEYK